MTGLYAVNNIYACIQGEGVYTGVPMVLLRLQGCGVGCPFCDTKETWAKDFEMQVQTINDAVTEPHWWVDAAPSEIAHHIATTYPTIKWVMLTGGEPAEQDLEALINAIHDTGRKIAMETSGTADGHLWGKARPDWVCVSPKIGMPGGKKILPHVIQGADEIKMVVGKTADIEKLQELIKSCQVDTRQTVICLQPMSTSNRATELCIRTVQENGWRLSIQVHKYLDLP